MAKEQDLRVDIVHGCITEGDDSVLRVFSWELLPATLQDNYCWLAN